VVEKLGGGTYTLCTAIFGTYTTVFFSSMYVCENKCVCVRFLAGLLKLFFFRTKDAILENGP